MRPIDFHYPAARNRAESPLLLRANFKEGGNMIQCKPYIERTPDTQYRELLRYIIDSGEEVTTKHGVKAKKIVGHLLRFDLRNGFPIITERNIVSPFKKSTKPPEWQQALGELCAFLNGAQTQTDLEKFGCYWWEQWVTEEQNARRGLESGDLGPASYGAAFRRFPSADGPFDQIAALVRQIREDPTNRYHEINPWIPQYLLRPDRKAAVPPCHGWFHVHINVDRGTLTLSHRQRSADAPVGLVFNLIHYAALTMMIGQVTGYIPATLVYILDDVHIYLNQIEAVEQMLAETKPGRFPSVHVDPSVTDIFAFRREHFSVEDYHPGPKRRIPTPL